MINRLKQLIKKKRLGFKDRRKLKTSLSGKKDTSYICTKHINYRSGMHSLKTT